MNDALTLTSAATLTRPHPWLDTTLYPFAPRRFRTADGEMSYLDVGSGPTVLFVHGTPSWSFEWRDVITALAPRFRCIAPDHLGFGLSEKPSEVPLAPEDHARRLRALVEHLDLRDVTLVVHDFGGPIGLPLALDGDRVSRVVLLNTWMWSNADDPRVVRLDRVVRGPIGRFLYRWLNFSPRFLLPGAMGPRRRLTRNVHRQYVAPFARRAHREGPYAMARALFGSNAHYASLWSKRSALAALPVAIVWGMKDPAFDPKALDRLVAVLPRAKVTRLDDVGHFPAEEHPDAVVRAIRELVEGA